MGQQGTLEQAGDGRTELRQPLRYEHHGIDTIPPSERRSTPWTFAILAMGNSFALGGLIFGWVPISLGLGFWPALSSIAAGALVALIPITPLVLIGTRAHTNNATSSGAAFGVRGRLIGSVLGLLIMLLSTAAAIWTGGQVLVAASGRLLHTPAGNGALAVAYVVITLLSILIAVYGYHLLARTALATMLIGIATMLLILVAFAAHLHPGYRGGGHYALGSFRATWLLSMLAIGVASVMSMSTMLGDWTRYIPGDRYPARRLLPVALPALWISNVVPMAVGALVTTAFVHPLAPFPANLVTQSSAWYVGLLVPVAIFGGLAWSGSNLYSSGLDLDAVFARLGRAGATMIVSAASVGLVLIGSLVWDASAAFSSFVVILLAALAPWAAVIGIGYLRCHGRYLTDDLQVFNRGRRGGAYWYSAGWNIPAVIAWAAGCLFGLLSVNTTLYTGPFARLANGVDLSFAGSFIIGAVLYTALQRLFPGLDPLPAQSPQVPQQATRT